jgi:hypothetical protein
MLVDAGDAVAVEGFDLAFDRRVDRGGEVAAGQPGEALPDHSAEDLDTQLGTGSPVGPD